MVSGILSKKEILFMPESKFTLTLASDVKSCDDPGVVVSPSVFFYCSAVLLDADSPVSKC